MKIQHLLLAALTLLSIPLHAQTPDVPEESVDTLDAARIYTDRIKMAKRSQTGLTRIDASKINSGFALFGSPDVIKTIQRMPGVASGTELLSGLYVHGGTGSDNLFLLDGTPLYSTSHLIGLFSSFNSDVVEDIDFYKSGFPARYGGRLSSVVDVNTRDGDFYDWHGSLSLGLIDGRFQIDGPLVKGKTSVNFGLRRTWMDVLTTPALAMVNRKTKVEDGEVYAGHYAFWDMNFGLTHLLSDKDKLQLTVFNGMDRLKGGFDFYDSKYDEAIQKRVIFYDRYDEQLKGQLAWGSTTAGLAWTHTFSDKLSARTRASYALSTNKTAFRFDEWDWDNDDTSIGYDIVAQEDNGSRVHDITLRSDFFWTPSRMHQVRFGGALQHHIYDITREAHTYVQPVKGERMQGTDVSASPKYTGEEASLYIEDEISLGDRWSLSPGLRYSAFNTGRKTYHSLEPRFAMRFDASKDIALKLSYTEMSQYVHLVQTLYVDLPTASWLPCTEKMKPMRSRQLAGGIYTKLPHGMHLDLEGFWKGMDHLYEYAGEFALYPPTEKWETSFTEGKGRAYGAELGFGWASEKTMVDASYTLSWSQRNFPEFFHTWYYDRNDYRNMLNLTATHKFSDKFEIYGAWTYHTGARMTLADQGINPGESTIWDEYGNEHKYTYYEELYTKPNNIRIPAYHRMDIGMNFHKTTKRGHEGIWNLSIYNAYCRMNPMFAEIDRDVDRNGTVKYTGTAYGIIPIVPTASYTLKF